MKGTIPVTSAYPVAESKPGTKAAPVVIEQPMMAAAPGENARVRQHGTGSDDSQGPRPELPSGPGSPGRLGEIVTAANRWRENYNPLRGLIMRRVVELIEAGQRGDTAYLQWTYRKIERSFPTLSALIERCESPLINFDWEIKIKEQAVLGSNAPAARGKASGDATDPKEPGETDETDEADAAELDEMAKAQQATLREAYERIDNLKGAIRFLHLSKFRGYAHLQKWRDEAGEVYHLEPLHQWCVCRDGLEGNWFWNPDSRAMSTPLASLGKEFAIGGEALPCGDFIVMEEARPVNEIALVLFVRENLAEKNWDAFGEIYWLPGGVVIMPGNVPQGKEGEYESAAQKIAEGGSGALPNGSDYKPNDGPRQVDPFTPRLKDLREQLVLVGTGGKLTMLAESGSGTLAGGAHTDTFEEITDARCHLISERFQRDFDAEILARKHPGEPVLVYFKIGKADSDSTETVAFKRDILKTMAGHEILSRVMANQTDLKETVRDVGIKVNEEYTDPYVPVVDAQGAGPTGEVIKDSQGDIVGAKEATMNPGAVGNPTGGNPENPRGGGSIPRFNSNTDGSVKNRGGFVTIDGHVVFVGPDNDTTDGDSVDSVERDRRGLAASSHLADAIDSFHSGRISEDYVKGAIAHYKKTTGKEPRFMHRGEIHESWDEYKTAAGVNKAAVKLPAEVQRQKDDALKVARQNVREHLSDTEHKRGAAGYLSEKIDFGGESVTRGHAIAQMQKEGHPQQLIDRYMQGQGSRTTNRNANAPSSTLEENAADHYAQALADDLAVVRQRMEALLTIQDPDLLRQRALEMSSELEKLEPEIFKAMKSGKVLAEINNAALISGLTGNSHAKDAKDAKD